MAQATPSHQNIIVFRLFEPLFVEVNRRCHNAELLGITQGDFIISRHGVHVGKKLKDVFSCPPSSDLSPSHSLSLSLSITTGGVSKLRWN
jgi:hypothetical protein